MTLLIADDRLARTFEPFALTRPVSELRAGAELLRRRWEAALGEPATGLLTAEHLRDFAEAGAPAVFRHEVPAGTLVANARFAAALERAPAHAAVWRNEGRVAAVRLQEPVAASAFDTIPSLDVLAPDGAREAAIEGWWIDAVWDLVRHLQVMMERDIAVLGPAFRTNHPSITRQGSHAVYIAPDAVIDPFVLFDASLGPILVRQGVTVRAFSRLVGPCVIGEGTTINGGTITGSSVGDSCRVHGEVSTTILVGHANKAHDGFLGHSVLGRWVNLGASTVNSNLKNTYGPVALWTPAGLMDTGMQFLGAFLGDHVRTAIGTRLTTGCVVGTGANIFGDRTVPKTVPPFAWGVEGDEVWDPVRFLSSAERVMARRQVTLDAAGRRLLTTAYERRWRPD
jgi:UDP-N-acetylglucosamine diphosphorylase/glucosamine-1-phosphate N-acetyltransferase